jgi:hypothetical protein
LYITLLYTYFRPEKTKCPVTAISSLRVHHTAAALVVVVPPRTSSSTLPHIRQRQYRGMRHLPKQHMDMVDQLAAQLMVELPHIILGLELRR